MRILFVVHQFYPEYAGGTEKVTYQLAKAAQRAGHFVRILTCRVANWKEDPGELLIDSVYHGIPVTTFQRKELPEQADIDLPVVPDLCKAIGELLEQEKYDVAHIVHTMRMGSAMEAISAAGIPYLLSITDFFAQCYRINLINVEKQLCNGANDGQTCISTCRISPWTKELLAQRSIKFKQVLMGASERVCPSEYVRNRFTSEFPDLSFRVIEHGIDLNMATLQREQHLPKDDDVKSLVFGFIGSFVPEKGLECIIQAFRDVKSPDVRLHLYGSFFGREEYEKAVSALVDADERITLKPFVEANSIYSVLMGFDVFCLPSIVPETFSLILRESAAAGTPVLVSDLGAPADYVHAHECGMVLSAGDTKAWTAAIEKILESPEMLERWKQNLPLPDRLEEEAFYFQSLYQKAILANSGRVD